MHHFIRYRCVDYDAQVSASLRMPDLYDSGTMHVTLTPFPEAIALTIEEALRVLYDFKHGNITQQELDEAKVPYLGACFSGFALAFAR